MPTRTSNRSSSSSRNRTDNGTNRARSSSDRSAFSWGDGGALVGAAIAGAAIAVAANLGRKAVTQGLSASAGEWDEVLAAEHDMALAIFDQLLATEDTQTFKRAMLLRKLTHALDKHAHEEEHVIYPALRDANEARDADILEEEHGHVKTFLFELNEMEKGSADFLPKVREFRSTVESHARMEEEQVFPRLKQWLTAEQNGHLTKLVNREGFKMA